MSVRRAGFSLLELVIACALFVGLSVLIFTFFRYATRAFITANQEHGLQTDALRVVNSLQTELRRSARSAVVVKRGPSREVSLEGQTVRRDAIAMASVIDWKDKTSSENYYLESGAPRWNCHWIFYASLEDPGRLIRLRVDPNPATGTPAPLGEDDLSLLYNNDPLANRFKGVTPPYATLAKNVYDFRVDPWTSGGFPVSLKLRENHRVEAVEAGARRDHDYYQLQLRIVPENGI